MSVSAILNRFMGTPANGSANQNQAASQGQPAQGGTPNNVATNSSNNTNQFPANNGNSTNNDNATSKAVRLEDFAPIFQKPTGDNSNKPNINQEPMFPDFTSQEFRENFNKQINFDAFLPDSAFTALATGNSAEFKASLNNAIRASMLYTFSGMGKLIEKAITDRFNTLDGLVTDKIKKSRVTSTLDSHPILSNPGVAPLRNALSEMFTGKYPDASPEDIKAFVDNYLITLADSIKPNAKPEDKNSKAVDWDSFLS